MNQNNESWFDVVKKVAHAFIVENCDEESKLFAPCWDVFSARIGDLTDSGREGLFESSVIQEISFANGTALDLVTPIVLATVAEAFYKINGKSVSASKAEEFVGRAALRFGAGAELTASLMRYIPSLCIEAMVASEGADKAVINHTVTAQYKIWAGGKTWVAQDITEYELKKDEYLFWLDLNEKSHISPISPGRQIPPRAVALLVYLVEHLGVPVPANDVLRDVFEDDRQKITEDRKDKVEQQLSKLEKFCGDHFREHLFGLWTEKGLGLKETFTDKYLFFSRL